MIKTTISLVVLLFFYLGINAQISDVQIKVIHQETQTPIEGATVYIKPIEKGSITDANGIANFNDIPDGKYQVHVSYIGFTETEITIDTPTQQVIEVPLKEAGHELEEIILTSNRSYRSIKNTPTRFEYIGGEELAEKNAMNATNISMVLRESTGIQMQQTSLSSGNTNIRIQGLDGRYTQLLRDGFPLYGGFSSGLSIMQIPPLDIKQFEIVKGSSSTLYGGGAIAGLVNIVTKTPEEEPTLDLMLTQTQALGTTANVFFSSRTNKWGTTIYGSGSIQKAYDPEGDDFSNLPKTRSITINPKLFYYPSDRTTIWVGLNANLDTRIGGDITKIEEDTNAILYTEENISQRISSQLVYETQIDSTQAIHLKNSIVFFDRNLTIPDFTFQGQQWNTFTEANYTKQGVKSDWVVGANLYTTSFNELADSNQRDQNDLTGGVFANNIYDITEKWILETGLRFDYAKDWGFFPLPRFSLLYKANTAFSSRIGGGLGYKIPDIFTEEAEFINFRNIQPINKEALDAERSYGLNFDINYQTRFSDEIGFSINQLLYLTSIDNSLLLNSSSPTTFEFENATDLIVSKGAETNIKFTYKDFKWFLNYAFIDTRLSYIPGNPQKPLTARHNGGSVIMYENATWRIGYETYYTGTQLLSNGTKTTDYITMGLLAMRNFDWGSVFVNFENFTDRRQSRFSPLVIPPQNNPTFTEIYAPTDGFIFSAGIIIKPFGNHSDHH